MIFPVRKIRFFAAAIAAALLCGSALATPAVSRQQTSPPQTQWPSVEDWARDLDFLAAELPQRHKNLFAKVSAADFRAAVLDFKAALPNLAQDEIVVRLLKLVASVGDSHTQVGYQNQDGAAVPLMIYWFDDGLWVRNTIAHYYELLHGRLTAVDGRPIEDVAADLAGLIPHENDAQVRNQVPNFLTDPFVLHGLKLIAAPDAARFTVRDSAGAEHSAELRAIPRAGAPKWLIDLNAQSASQLYLKNARQYYWYEIVAEAKTLFFQYNSCQEIPGHPFAKFVRDMFAAADAGGVERVVVDLRLNGGGNSAVFRPFVNEIKARPSFNRRGRLFVLIGRRTFSSALLNAVEMKKETAALFAGEPTGGKPNHFGEIRSFQLPKSRLSVSYSTKYFQEVDGDPASLEPDLRIQVNYADRRAGRDPVLAAVLAYEK